MEDMDKAIEIMKAAMEKEKMMKENQDKKTNPQIDEEAASEEMEAKDEANVKEDQMPENEESISDEETEASEEEDSDKDNKSDKSTKSLFKNSKAKELAAKDQKIAGLSDRLLRNMAEFDNFRKRSEKEKSMMFDMGVKSVIEKILPIVDNFERGLGAISEEEKGSAFAQGIEMIYRQLMNCLDEIGVKPIEAVGQKFDPNLHNAVMHGEDENYEENTITDEFQKGYMYHDMVVRHSMVKVVN